MEELDNKFDHPLYNPMWLKFMTPEVKALDQKLQQWIYCGITGAIVLGDARTGKTTAIEMLSNSYKTRSDQSPISSHTFIVPQRDQPTVRNCLRCLFMSTGDRLRMSHSADKLSEQIVDYFTDLASYNKESTAIMFVDEFQRLSIKQLDVFADLQNSLRSRGITLFIYFIGNIGECENILTEAEGSRYDHIRGRFFTQQYRFHGIKSEKQVKACLRLYDTLRFPEDGGPTYSEHFLPKAYKRGWRLEKESGIVWRAFNGHKKIINIPSWGMKYFIGAINPLLTDYLPNYGVDKINVSMVNRCIEISGLIPSNIKKISNE